MDNLCQVMADTKNVYKQLSFEKFQDALKYDFMRHKKYRQTSADYIRQKFRLDTAIRDIHIECSKHFK